MERYFKRVQKSPRYQPYKKQDSASFDLPAASSSDFTLKESDLGRLDSTRSSVSTINKRLLATLGDPSNPITHSDIGNRSDRVISTSTGHQVAEDRPDRRLSSIDREKKLILQRGCKNSTLERKVLSNVRVYINGYLSCTTDIEMKRLVVEAGGHIQLAASRCTHVVTSHGLNASETHIFLTKNRRNKIHIVKPEWVIDSIAAGRRRPERLYSAIQSNVWYGVWGRSCKQMYHDSQPRFLSFKTLFFNRNIGGLGIKGYLHVRIDEITTPLQKCSRGLTHVKTKAFLSCSRQAD